MPQLLLYTSCRVWRDCNESNI